MTLSGVVFFLLFFILLLFTFSRC